MLRKFRWSTETDMARRVRRVAAAGIVNCSTSPPLFLWLWVNFIYLETCSVHVNWEFIFITIRKRNRHTEPQRRTSLKRILFWALLKYIYIHILYGVFHAYLTNKFWLPRESVCLRWKILFSIIITWTNYQRIFRTIRRTFIERKRKLSQI